MEIPTAPTFPVSPEIFWEIFSDSLRLCWIGLEESDRKDTYNNGEQWTTFLTGFLLHLSAQFVCIADTEYWPRVDVGYFDKPGDDWGEWAMEVAIELENDARNWHEEISKLLMINAGLKVLVCYPESIEYRRFVLNRFIDIHKSRKYFTTSDSWLFIFAPRLLPTNEDFVALKSDGKNFFDITCGKRIISEVLETPIQLRQRKQ